MALSAFMRKCFILLVSLSSTNEIVLAWSPISIQIGLSRWASSINHQQQFHRPFHRPLISHQPLFATNKNNNNAVVPIQKTKNTLERATQPKRSLDHTYNEPGHLQTVPDKPGGELQTVDEEKGEMVVSEEEVNEVNEDEEAYKLRAPQEIKQTPTKLANKLNEHLLEEWRVLLHNDDINTFHHVETALVQVVPHMVLAKAKLIANTVHEDGVGTVIAIMKPIAEKISMALQSFGLTTTTAPDKNFEP